MEEKLVKRSDVSFVTEALQTLEGARKWAQTYLDSKMAPAHFYEKKDGKPDYTRGNAAAVVAVMAHGYDVRMSSTQAIQQIVPINGLTSIKGDGAKALIMASGLCAQWAEEFTGTLDEGNLTCVITSKRKDTGEVLQSSFSVDDAKRAGLWVDTQKLSNKASLRYSPWYTYPRRMLKYRALGFLARDLYPDVMQGMVTEEEARDYPEGTTTLETSDGKKIEIDAGNAAHERSESLTNKASETIDKKNEPLGDEVPETAAVSEDLEQDVHVYMEQELIDMKEQIVDHMQEKFPDAAKSLFAMPGKNTNKKWRLGIMALQAGRFDEYVGQTEAIEEKKSETPAAEKKSEEVKEFENNMDGGGADLAQVKENELGEPAEPFIHKGVTIAPLPESGSRAFPSIRAIFQGMQSIGILEDKYKEIASELIVESSGDTFIATWGSMELFSKLAGSEHVVELIDTFLEVNA